MRGRVLRHVEEIEGTWEDEIVEEIVVEEIEGESGKEGLTLKEEEWSEIGGEEEMEEEWRGFLSKGR